MMDRTQYFAELKGEIQNKNEIVNDHEEFGLIMDFLEATIENKEFELAKELLDPYFIVLEHWQLANGVYDYNGGIEKYCEYQTRLLKAQYTTYQSLGHDLHANSIKLKYDYYKNVMGNFNQQDDTGIIS